MSFGGEMISRPISEIAARPASRLGAFTAFTLLELLVVIAIIALLAGLLLPVLARAKEKANVTRVRAELYGIGLALEMYSTDYAGKLPPVRVNCNSDLMTHWCELPVELAALNYLGGSKKAGCNADLEDVFNPDHTYKYAAPGPELLNGSPTAPYKLWVPTNFPANLGGSSGQYYSDPKISPVRWVVWSLGPQPKSPKTLSSYAPMSSDTWYHHAGDGGVIARYADRNGTQFASQ
jgi:prepilin-type N-terminal cleavage/methylation domain-containing protein